MRDKSDMCYAYVLQNELGKYYIGSCEDINKRLKKHNTNSVRSTKNKGLFKIVYREEFSTKVEARKRENQIKSYKGNSSFKRLLKKCASPSSSLV